MESKIVQYSYQLADLIPGEPESGAEEATYDIQAEEDQETIYRKIDWLEVTDEIKMKPFILEDPQILVEGPIIPDRSPVGLFMKFFDEPIWQMMEEQTNLYLEQARAKKSAEGTLKDKSRLAKAKPVTQKELQKWIGLRMLMSLHSNTQIKSNLVSFDIV